MESKIFLRPWISPDSYLPLCFAAYNLILLRL